jgi:hypothetical protein
MRIIIYLIILSALGTSGWYAWQHGGPIRKYIDNHLPANSYCTLEIRHSAEEIMQAQKTNLLKNQGYSFLEPKLLFYPYLLMDVKYSKQGSATSEGILLWGLNDGEMVLHTGTWEKTHGFEDCLAAKANKNDFKIIEALIANGGIIDREKLYQTFNVDADAIDAWVDSCRQKKLVVNSGNKFRLHFQNPRLQTEPVTTIDQLLVTQPAKYSQQKKARYTSSQIKRLAQTAFGTDFAIRKTEKVFLPVFAISVQNPDGSILTTHWNALNGKKFDLATR